jgi:hypothetical protein
MKPSWVTVAARPAVGSFAREVRAEMTALFASTAAASGTGLSARATRTTARAAGCPPPTARTASAPDHPDHAIGNPGWDVGSLAPVLARRLDGRPGRPAATGRRPLPAALGGLSGVIGDRPHKNVLTSRAASAVAAASPPSPPRGGTSDSGLTPYRRASCGKCGACPLPLMLHAEDPRPQMSRDTRCRDPPGTALRCLLPEAAEQSGVRCRQHQPGRSGHSKAPWTIRQDHPGGKAPAMRTHHAS